VTGHLAYLAQGKLHWQGDGSPRELESRFGRSLRDRAAQIHNRHAWKMQGTSAQFMRGMLWSGMEHDPAAFRIAMTSVTRGRAPGELLYSLETDEISGVFAVDSTGAEQRLFHTADFRIRHLAMHPDGDAIAASVCHSDLVANLAVLNADGSDLREVSEGDSIDLAPRWVPGPARRLVFQSAGLGRDAAGACREPLPLLCSSSNWNQAKSYPSLRIPRPTCSARSRMRMERCITSGVLVRVNVRPLIRSVSSRTRCSFPSA
jgi:hypothetical protein